MAFARIMYHFSNFLKRFEFSILVILLQCLGIACLTLVVVWMAKYQGGFAWDGSHQQFNYHPVCMVLSMVFISSEGMIIYRVFSQDNKMMVKLLHMFIQIVAFIVAVMGLKAVFDFHNHNNIPNVYSLHSWLGIAVAVLFTSQWVFGFSAFLFPKFPDGLRALYLKIHVFFGMAIFLLAIATCLTGITEKAFFSVPNYKDLPAQAIVINMLGVMLVLHGGLTYFIVTNEKYKQLAGPPVNDEHCPLVSDATGHEDTPDHGFHSSTTK